MDTPKDLQALSDDELSLVSGGGTGEAEAYLKKLESKYNCDRWDLKYKMTQAEYAYYAALYNNLSELPPDPNAT